MSAAEVLDPPVDDRAARILDAVELRTHERGIRAVVMAEVARDLGISTKTLYREFPSKDALVQAMVERWGTRLMAADEAMGDDVPPVERLRSTVRRLTSFRARFCDEFWHDLKADHPEAWARFVELFDVVQRRSSEWMVRSVRPGVDPEFARSILRAGILAALRPEALAVSDMTPDAAIDAVVDLWAHGALAPAPSAHSKSRP